MTMTSILKFSALVGIGVLLSQWYPSLPPTGGGGAGSHRGIYYVHATGGNDTTGEGTQSRPWRTLAKLQTVPFETGAIVDGMGQTYYESLAVPVNNITIRNFTMDGSKGLTNTWYLLSNEIWTNALVRSPIYFWEDNVRLTPRLVDNGTDASTNMVRGEWAWRSGVLYYRASNGSVPSGHALRITSREYENNYGFLSIRGRSGVAIRDATVQNFASFGTNGNYNIYVLQSANVTLSNVITRMGRIGCFVVCSTNVWLTNFTCVSNCNSGFGCGANYVTGDALYNLWASGTFNYNGTEMIYYGTEQKYTGDGDGIGIGQGGGPMGNINLLNCTIWSNGPPQNITNIMGSGVMLDTVYDFTCTNLTVNNCYIRGNHNFGLYVGANTFEKTITGNIIQFNCNPTNASRAAVFIKHDDLATNTLFASNLISENSCTNSGTATSFSKTGSYGLIIATNNVWWNNGPITGTSDYNCDVSLSTSTNNLYWDYNQVLRDNGNNNRGAWFNTVTYYVLSVTNTLATATGWMNNIASTNAALVNPTDLTYVP